MAARNESRTVVKENPVMARPAARMEVKDIPVSLRAQFRIFFNEDGFSSLGEGLVAEHCNLVNSYVGNAGGAIFVPELRLTFVAVA